jgi:MFS family permease
VSHPPRRLPIIALLLANAISLIGEALTTIAIPWYVYQTTGSAARMGVVGFFTVLPRVLATFFGGSLIDRIGFKRVSVTADTLSGLSVAAIPLLHHTTGLGFPMLIALVFLGAFFDGPGTTARESLVPDLAKLAGFQLERVNAIYQMVQRLGSFIGPALAGVLIAILGASNVLWVDAASFAISVVLIGLAVPRLRVVHAHTLTVRYWEDLASGLRFIRADAVLFWLAISVAATNFFEAPLGSVLMPVFTRQEYGGVERLGLIFSLFGAGAVLSSIAFATYVHRLPRHRTFATAFLIVSVPYFVLASAPPYLIVLLACFLMGCAAGPINPILMTVQQERVPEAIRARIFGIFTSLALVAMPLGQLLGGFTVATIGPQATFAVVGACFFAVTATLQVNRALRAMDRKPEPLNNSLRSI